jgi:hypothetical protein
MGLSIELSSASIEWKRWLIETNCMSIKWFVASIKTMRRLDEAHIYQVEAWMNRVEAYREFLGRPFFKGNCLFCVVDHGSTDWLTCRRL